jgi:hypothetical protein
MAVVAGLASAGAAHGKPLREIGRVAVTDGVIGDAFALDERGARIGYVVTDGKGKTSFRAGPPGGARPTTTDIGRFGSSIERVVAVGPGWFLVANEGKRRALAIGPTGAFGPQIGPFTDAQVSTAKGASSPLFVAVTDRGDGEAGHAYDVAAYRAGGATAGRKAITVAADGTIAGTKGLVFQAFTNGFLQAMVKQPGRYDRRVDARGPEEAATFDLLTGAVSGAHRLGDLHAFGGLMAKRAEQPGQEVFVRLGEREGTLELVGPGEKTRALAFPGTFAAYDAPSLAQQPNGGRLYFSLVLDPLPAPGDTAPHKAAKALHVFEVNVAAARAQEIGEIPLGDDARPFAWVAGGDKVAFMRKTMGAGGSEIVVYQR